MPAGRRASSSTCWNMARRIGLKAHVRAEPTRLSAGFTGPRPPQPEASHQNKQLCCGGVKCQMSNDVAGQARYLGPLRARDICFSPERNCTCINLISSGATITCDPQVRIFGQDAV
jgi:hypothetical protein